jgi:hypothetical protein
VDIDDSGQHGVGFHRLARLAVDLDDGSRERRRDLQQRQVGFGRGQIALRHVELLLGV